MKAISLLGALGALPLDGEPRLGTSKFPKPSKHVMIDTCLSQGVDLDSWIEKVNTCHYLQEDELKSLCEYVSPIFCIPDVFALLKGTNPPELDRRQKKYWLRSPMSSQ